jgi:hypothetical protein
MLPRIVRQAFVDLSLDAKLTDILNAVGLMFVTNGTIEFTFHKHDKTIKADIVAINNTPIRLKKYTVAQLTAITDPTDGDIAMATDVLSPVFGAAVVGGGAVKIPVHYDGGWKVG